MDTHLILLESKLVRKKRDEYTENTSLHGFLRGFRRSNTTLDIHTQLLSLRFGVPGSCNVGVLLPKP